MSDDVTVDSVWMKDSETIKDHYVFKTDSTGQTLKYKILIKDNSIADILYNTGSETIEIPFDETRINSSQIMQIHDENLFGDNVVIVKI